MSGKLRDFLNRREPGARWMLLLLAVLLVVELVVLFTVHAPRGEAGTPIYLWPPIAAAVALALQRWWSLPASPAFPDPKFEIPHTAKRWVWMMAAAITLLAAWPRSARLEHGGSEVEAGNITLVAQSSAPWHLKEGCVSLQMTDGSPLAGSERKSRTLPLIAGLLVAGMLVLVGASLGSPRGGMAAGLIVALHPAHVQWSSEISDFPLQQLGILTAVYCLIAALRTNAWRWWIALGLLSNLFTAGHFTSVIVLLLLCIAGAIAASRSAQSMSDRLAVGLRCLVAWSVSTAAMIIPTTVITSFREATPAVERWAIFAAGGSGGNALLVNTVLPLIALGGIWFMLRQDWRTRLAAPIMLLPLLIADPADVAPVFMETTACLPLLLVWAGVGMMRLFPKTRYAAHAPVLVAVLCVFIMSPRLQRVMKFPQNPTGEAARAARSEHGAKVTTVVPAPDSDLARRFDPAVLSVNSAADLKKLTDTAFDSDTPLMLYFRRSSAPAEVLNEVATGERFQLRAEFPAVDPQNTVLLYEYHPVEQIIRLNIPRAKK